MERPNSDLKTSYFSLGDILALGLMIAAGLYFILTSALKIADLILGSMSEFELLQNILGAIAGYGFIFGAYRFVTKSTYLKTIADKMFVEAIYDRLEPVLADIAETKASNDILSERIDNLNYNVDDIRKSIELGKTTGSHDLVPVQFAIRTIAHQFQYTMLTTITLALYMFMYYNPGSITPYVSPIVYVLWWGITTSQHDMWEAPKAWYWIAVPLLVIPMYTVLFTELYTANYMLFIMYVGLGAYVFSYYIWCEYTVRGILPFGIGKRLHNIRTMIIKAQDQEIKTPVKQTAFHPYHIGLIMITFSILAFAISIVGYLVENRLVEISWQMIGLDFKWQPLYSYATVVIGIVLLTTGYLFVIKFRGKK